MTGVLSGFGVIVAVVALGWIIARSDVLGEDALHTVNRLVFYVATPALLFDSLARTSPSEVFTPVFWVCASSAIIVAALYGLVVHLWLRRPLPDLLVGALAAGYVNSANLGIPIAMYVLGDLGFVFPLLMFQVLVLQPVAIAVLEHRERETGRPDVTGDAESSVAAVPAHGIRTSVGFALRNPLILAALSGLLIGALRWTPPDRLLAPVHLLGQMSVPGALLVFGMSMYGVRVLERGVSPRREIAVASVGKLLVHPVIAWVIAGPVLGLSGHLLLTAVVAAGLPTAQNVLVLATRYDRGTLLARDTAVLTTLGAVPVLLVIAALFS